MAAKSDGADPAPTTGGAETLELTYEQARDELAGIVDRLEAGGVTLEESLALWQRGEELYRFCRDKLDAAEGEIEELAKRAEAAAPPSG